MNARQIMVATACAALWQAQATASEYKVATIGVGRAADPDSVAYTFELNFNKPEADDPPDGHALAVFRSRSGRGSSDWFFAPNATASLGNGAQAASDNVTLSTPFMQTMEFRSAEDRGGKPEDRKGRPELSLTKSISPVTLASNKAFSDAILYARVSSDLYYQHRIRKRPDGSLSSVLWGTRAGLRLDPGARLERGERTGPMFLRIVPSCGFGIDGWKYFQFKAEGDGFLLYNDPRLGSYKGFGLVKLALAVRFRGSGPTTGDMPPLFPIGVTLKYALGNDEPTYERQNVVTVGLSLYTKPARL